MSKYNRFYVHFNQHGKPCVVDSILGYKIHFMLLCDARKWASEMNWKHSNVSK